MSVRTTLEQPSSFVGPSEEPAPGPPGPVAPDKPEGERDRQRGSSRVLVLNSSYEPLNVCTVRRAIVLVLKEKAEMLETGSRELHSESVTLPQPLVIRLVTYVRVPRDSTRRRITRRAVFARDSWTCQYCGRTSHLTEVNMHPRRKPKAPGPTVFIRVAAPVLPEAWQQYLVAA
jgi:5-methylcytosine-specific restriction endonuclease McrA